MIRPLRATSACAVLAASVLASCGLELPEGLAPDAQQLADDAVDGQDTISIATALAGLPSLVLTADSLSLAEAVERQAEIAA